MFIPSEEIPAYAITLLDWISIFFRLNVSRERKKRIKRQTKPSFQHSRVSSPIHGEIWIPRNIGTLKSLKQGGFPIWQMRFRLTIETGSPFFFLPRVSFFFSSLYRGGEFGCGREKISIGFVSYLRLISFSRKKLVTELGRMDLGWLNRFFERQKGQETLKLIKNLILRAFIHLKRKALWWTVVQKSLNFVMERTEIHTLSHGDIREYALV